MITSCINDHVAELRRLSTHPTTQQYFSKYAQDLLNSSADVIEHLRSRTSRSANTGTICNIDNLMPAVRRSFIADVLKQNDYYKNQIQDLFNLIDEMLEEMQVWWESEQGEHPAAKKAMELLSKREL